jgi:8-oxo-dGTP pyrophosphatase MutT (NUDIX family)
MAGNATSRVSYDGRMAITDDRAALREGLDADPRPTPDPGERLAAVLALLIEEPEPSLLFTERAATLSRHPGEVSFPGGLTEPQDDHLAATALRETFEEIGLDPSLPELLGALPPIHTFVSGVLVTPFVAAIRSLPELRVSRAEIARVLTVPTLVLASLEQERELHREGGRVWQGWWYETDDATIWGATGFMLHAFLEHARVRAPWLTSN